MSLRDDIKALYRANPELSGKQILEALGRTGTRQEWKILNETQVQMRGNAPARRKNHNKGPLHSWRGHYLHGKPMGPTRSIPDDEKAR